MSYLSDVRRASYTVARVLGDVQAASSGSPSRILKRLANKWLGRNLVRRVWFK